MIPEAAVEAAVEAHCEGTMRAALEAAAPHMLADYLGQLAADARTRGDIGKDQGIEAWDYLTSKAALLTEEAK